MSHRLPEAELLEAKILEAGGNCKSPAYAFICGWLIVRIRAFPGVPDRMVCLELILPGAPGERREWTQRMDIERFEGKGGLRDEEAPLTTRNQR